MSGGGHGLGWLVQDTEPGFQTLVCQVIAPLQKGTALRPSLGPGGGGPGLQNTPVHTFRPPISAREPPVTVPLRLPRPLPAPHPAQCLSAARLPLIQPRLTRPLSQLYCHYCLVLDLGKLRLPQAYQRRAFQAVTQGRNGIYSTSPVGR